jgi:uncharacterized protein (DUF697 family)
LPTHDFRAVMKAKTPAEQLSITSAPGVADTKTEVSDAGHPVPPTGAEQPSAADESERLRRLREADNIVKNHIIAVMGASLVPIPLVDLVALTSVQLKMLQRLAALYEVPFTRNVGKQLIVSLLGGVLPTSAAITFASFTKTIPGMGTTTGMISVSTIGGAITYAIGQAFIRHFDSGGTLLDVDLKRLRRLFRSKVREGKQEADQLKARTSRGGKGRPLRPPE